MGLRIHELLGVDELHVVRNEPIEKRVHPGPHALVGVFRNLRNFASAYDRESEGFGIGVDAASDGCSVFFLELVLSDRFFENGNDLFSRERTRIGLEE